MPNTGWPTVQYGDEGDAVKQAQRGLRRTPNLSVVVDGVFGPATEEAVKQFQDSAGLTPSGVVDEVTWEALPNGMPMPVLQEGSQGDAVRSLQTILTKGAYALWEVTPDGIDGIFGSKTAASVRAFQTWARIKVDGIVGQQTWDAAGSLEFVVGLQHAVGVQPV
jgi:peptidoglycan hydrolase-like protein with peptidoglycan-binding domain